MMAQVDAVPREALDAYAEVLSVLETVPWNGGPQNEVNPEGALRRSAGPASHPGRDLPRTVPKGRE